MTDASAQTAPTQAAAAGGPATALTDDERRERNLAAVKARFARMGTADAATADNYTDDAVLEMPYADPPVVLRGRDEILARVGPALDTFHFTLEITAVHHTVDPDTLILEYVSDGHVVPTGKAYRNTYIGIFRFRDGQVCGVKEFYNPLVAARALQPDA